MVGTSERGIPIDVIGDEEEENQTHPFPPNFKHLLIVFGGVEGLEKGLEQEQYLYNLQNQQEQGEDEVVEYLNVSKDEAHTLFHYWINTCPNQGSGTIRTEEAIPITLARLQPLINSAQKSTMSINREGEMVEKKKQKI